MRAARLTCAFLGLALLGATPALAGPADPLQAAIERGAHRVRASYAETGMSGMSGLVDTCLRQAKRRPSRETYGECVAIVAGAIALDKAGAARFHMPPLLSESGLYRKSGPPFLAHGGSEGDLLRIHRSAPSYF